MLWSLSILEERVIDSRYLPPVFPPSLNCNDAVSHVIVSLLHLICRDIVIWGGGWDQGLNSNFDTLASKYCPLLEALLSFIRFKHILIRWSSRRRSCASYTCPEQCIEVPWKPFGAADVTFERAFQSSSGGHVIRSRTGPEK